MKHVIKSKYVSINFTEKLSVVWYSGQIIVDSYGLFAITLFSRGVALLPISRSYGVFSFRVFEEEKNAQT